MKTKTCKCGCKKKASPEKGVVINMSWFISFDHAVNYASKKGKQSVKRQLSNKKKAEVADRKALKTRKKEVMRISEWYDKLQKVVNQYVLHVRDKDKPCCTCGTTNNIKFDAGHFRSRGSCPELRFELTNIHKQCSVQCNGFKSGARAEYNEFIKTNYGIEHYNWLIGRHQLLKERFPHWTDVEKEILRYRKLLRKNGLTPYS